MATLNRTLVVFTFILCAVCFGLCLLAMNLGAQLPPTPQLTYTLPNESGYGTTIWLMDIDHRLPLRLTEHAAPLNNLVWSPDGAHIAYHVLNAAEHQLHIYTPATGARGIFRSRPVYPSAPTWSPDSRRLTLISDQDRGLFKLYIMDARTTNLTLIPTESGAFDRPPLWSPDGQSIYFFSLDNALQRGINRYDLRAGRESIVRSFDERNFAFSADASHLLFLADQSTLIVDDLTQPETTRRTYSLAPHITQNPLAWSPDGDSVIFVSLFSGTSQLYRLSLDDGTIHPFSAIRNALNPVWSADGSMLAFLSMDAVQASIYICDPDGNHVRRIAQLSLPDMPIITWRTFG